MNVNSFFRITGVSRRLRRKVLLVLLSGVWLIGLLAVSINFSPKSEYVAKRPSLGEQSILSIHPQVALATNQLAENIRLSTDRITDTVKRLIGQESDKAEVQFKRTVPHAERPADSLNDAIKRTLVERIGNALRE